MLGTILAAERAQPVAWLARDMSGNRQNVQRIVNDLSADGLVAFLPNPHHRRAQLVVRTDKGKEALDAAMNLQTPWINSCPMDFASRTSKRPTRSSRPSAAASKRPTTSMTRHVDRHRRRGPAAVERLAAAVRRATATSLRVARRGPPPLAQHARTR